MTKKQKRMLMRIGGAAALFIRGMILEDITVGVVLLLAAYALISWDILWRAAVNIRQGRVFDENFLIAVATLGAIALGDYSEGVAVMLLYQIGEWFQGYAVQRSRRSISSLMDIRPDTACVLRNGAEEEVFPDEVEVGETIIVRPGERVPLDGIIRKGEGLLDTSALTGESIPRAVRAGNEIISGCINQTGVLEVEVTTPYE